MENNVFDKTSMRLKDKSLKDDTSIKKRVFFYFDNILVKSSLNKIVYSLLILLETLQICSYAYSEPLASLWKLDNEKMNLVTKIIGGARITPLLDYISFDIYIIIFSILIGLKLFFGLSLITALQINNKKSKLYSLNIMINRTFFNIFTIVSYIPETEIILLVLRCDKATNKVSIINNGIQCFKGIHYLYIFLGIIMNIVYFIILFLNSIFNFETLILSNSTARRINSSPEKIMLLIKVVAVSLFLSQSSDWISVLLLLFCSVVILSHCKNNPTYNNDILEFFITLRNFSFFWTYFITLIQKILSSTKYNGGIYLVLFGYPLIILISLVSSQVKNINHLLGNSHIADSDDYLRKLKYLINLIEDFLQKSKTDQKRKNELLLKGYISIHEEKCLDEDCPLKSFIQTDNETIKKMALLNYINHLFSEGMKRYPHNRSLMIFYINFNYEKKYNMNTAKVLLGKLEEMNKGINEEFLLFRIQEKSKLMTNRTSSELTDKINEEDIKIDVLNEFKFKRLKYLIEESTKLFSDFWGNLTTNLATKINIKKIFYLGKKLNVINKEIHDLWENDLKKKTIDYENQAVVQLYVYYLRTIIQNRRLSEEIAKSINEDIHFDNRKYESIAFDMEKLESFLEYPDMLVYSRTNEKGECYMINCSNTFTKSLGYTKKDIVGKEIEMLMPTIYLDGHAKMLTARIKIAKGTLFKNTFRDHSGTFEKKQNSFSIPKSKLGFIVPLSVRFTLYTEDDFSNSYIIKGKFESRDGKTSYPYYILAREDFSIDSISSSAMNLGLSLDLLKKHIIDLSHLIRDDNMEEISFKNKYQDYEEESKRITWIYPDKIYPKEETEKVKEEDIARLINESPRQKFNLLITRLKYREEETLGYCLRLIEEKEIKNLKETTDPLEIKTNVSFNFNYDIENFNYIRSKLVKDKPKSKQGENQTKNRLGLQLIPPVQKLTNKLLNRSDNKNFLKQTKQSKSSYNDEGSEDNDDEIFQLTEEAINHLKAINSKEIYEFIYRIPFYGQDISLEKLRPNKERYPVGKIAEPEIKISLESFKKRMEGKIKRSFENNNRKNKDSSPKNLTRSQRTMEIQVNDSAILPIQLTENHEEEMSYDSAVLIKKFIDHNSIIYIEIMALIIFLFTLASMSIDFVFSLNYLSQYKTRLNFSSRSYDIIIGMMYTKYFISEATFAGNPTYTNINNSATSVEYIIDMMKELSYYRDTITSNYEFFTNSSNALSSAYRSYVDNISFNLMTLSNNEKKNDTMTLQNAMNRMTTNIFFVSTVNDNYHLISMKERNTFELMMNTLNEYLFQWGMITNILFKDVYQLNNNPIENIILYVTILGIYLICLGILYKILLNYMRDKEKPINLFLSIKKQKFDELKNASELFLNKLLNKILGNDEMEQENVTIDTHSVNMSNSSEMIILRLNSNKNDNKKTRPSGDFIIICIKILIFFIVIALYFIMQIILFKETRTRLYHYTQVVNVTKHCEANAIISVNYVKSLLFDVTIPLNNTSAFATIFKHFLSITDSFQDFIATTYNNGNVLSTTYSNYFFKRISEDISAILISPLKKQYVFWTLKEGFKAVIMIYFEILKFIGFTKSMNLATDFISVNYFEDINNIARNVIRPWFNDINTQLSTSYNDFMELIKLVELSSFICIAVLVILCYIILWKNYEKNLKDEFQTSVDLINLIPEEIRMQLMKKINEEEEKLQ